MMSFMNPITAMPTYVNRENTVDVSKWTLTHRPGTLIAMFKTPDTKASLAILIVPVNKDRDYGVMYLALREGELIHVEDGAYEVVSNT